MNKKTIITATIFAAAPLAIFAAGDIANADELFEKLASWLSTIGQLIIAATVVAFFWGLFQFVFNEEKKDDGKRIMLSGIGALFIMVSIWGIIAFLQGTTGTENSNAPTDLQNLVPDIK